MSLDLPTPKVDRDVWRALQKRFPLATALLADSSVTTPKIADTAVTTPKLSAALQAQLNDTGWVAVQGGVGFQNAWVNFGSTFAPVAYRKIGNVVSVQGLCMSGGLPATIFTLPTGFRPTAGDLVFGVDSNTNAHARCDINTAGQVIPRSGSNVYFSLSGIEFTI